MRRALLLAALLAAAPAAATPHTRDIVSVTLTQDGRAAVTADWLGGLRLWPSLDGRREPFAVELAGARALSLRRDGHAWRLGVVDSAQGGRVLRVAPGGALALEAATPLGEPVLALQLTRDGFLALFADRSLRAFTRDGAETARLQRRGFRPELLALSADGSRAVLFDAASGTVVRLTVPDLAPDGPPLRVPAADPRFAPAALAVSPDGSLVVANEVLLGRGDPTALGKTGDTVVGFLAPTTVLMLADDRLAQVHLEDGFREPIGEDLGALRGAVGGGVLAVPAGGSLELVGESGAPRYLGYDLPAENSRGGGEGEGYLEPLPSGGVELQVNGPKGTKALWTLHEPRCVCAATFESKERVRVTSPTVALIVDAATGRVLERQKPRFGLYDWPVTSCTVPDWLRGCE